MDELQNKLNDNNDKIESDNVPQSVSAAPSPRIVNKNVAQTFNINHNDVECNNNVNKINEKKRKRKNKKTKLSIEDSEDETCMDFYKRVHNDPMDEGLKFFPIYLCPFILF